METSKKEKKVTVRISDEEYKALRIRLLEKGKTVSGWFREVVQELLSNNR